MRPNDLLEALRQQPFHPLLLHLSNGNTIEIRHPELVMVGRSTAMNFYPAHDQPQGIFDRYETIALLHINRIEIIPSSTQAQPSQQNGS